MADFDVYNDKAPFRKQTSLPNLGRPTVAQLKTALTTYNATSYTADRLGKMTKNDMVNAIRVHGLTVNTTLV